MARFGVASCVKLNNLQGGACDARYCATCKCPRHTAKSNIWLELTYRFGALNRLNFMNVACNSNV